jgi:hypothetical protein
LSDRRRVKNRRALRRSAEQVEAKPEQGQNTNEFRLEYQITPRWTFQLRGGDAQSGSASLKWRHDY